MGNKEVLKMALPSIYFMLIVYTIYIFSSKKGLFAILFIILFVTMFRDFLPILVKNSKKYVKMTITLLCFFLLIRFLGIYGILGFILSVLLIAGYRIYKSRKFFMETIRNLETMIFGHPLDMKQCSKNETIEDITSDTLTSKGMIFSIDELEEGAKDE